MTARHVGARLKRPDDPRLLTGRGRYLDDLTPPRMAHVAFVPFTRALTLWISTQVPHMMQAVVADLFGLPEQRVRVIAPDVGGSFGIKIHIYQDDMAGACSRCSWAGRSSSWRRATSRSSPT